MTSSLSTKLDATFKGVEVGSADDGRLTVGVPRESVVPVLTFLKEEGYDYLQLISCVDWFDRGEFELVYLLSFYTEDEIGGEGARQEILLKTTVPREQASAPTAMGVFAIAEPHEREIHELYGIHFEGHPRLIPLFLDRDYEIPPFRKDFDTKQYVADVFDRVPPIDEEG